MKVSIIICTHNRDFILPECLEAIINQTTDKSYYEVIIIDNCSTDKTPEITKQFELNHENVYVFIESNIGLSAARNRGFSEATNDWIGYLDDDAIVKEDFIEHVLNTIRNYEFDCFGGCYKPWFKYGQPKWFPKDFESNCLDKTTIREIIHEGIWGAVFFTKKEILKKYGGFRMNLGMSGNKIGYGEETHFIEWLKLNNYSLGINPNISIHHLVNKNKLKLNWHIRSAFARGRDNYYIQQEKNNNQLSLFKFLIPPIKIFIFSIIKGPKKLLSNNEYYFENYIIDTFSPIAQIVGISSIAIKQGFKS